MRRTFAGPVEIRSEAPRLRLFGNGPLLPLAGVRDGALRFGSFKIVDFQSRGRKEATRASPV
jgi:hypothetical protein